MLSRCTITIYTYNYDASAKCAIKRRNRCRSLSVQLVNRQISGQEFFYSHPLNKVQQDHLKMF